MDYFNGLITFCPFLTFAKALVNRFLEGIGKKLVINLMILIPFKKVALEVGTCEAFAPNDR